MELTETDRKLLESVKEKPRYLDMGRSPVPAIQKVWEFEQAGLVTNIRGWVYITEQGRKALEVVKS